MSNVTIVGGGIGGFTLASELRKRGWDQDIVIIDPAGLPYDRPPLSKEALMGSKSPEDLLLAPEQWYKDNNITVTTGEVTRVDADQKKLILSNGGVTEYDKLVLATGGHARRGDTPGFDDDDIIVLRTTEDALALRESLTQGATVGIIGAGLIGAEVASSARSLGANVVLIDPAPISLIPAVGFELAERLHGLHEDHGVQFVNGMTTGVEKHGERFHVSVDGFDTVCVDALLLCIGLVPDESLADSAELECDGGVLVDHDQCTDNPDIWAIGDCARHKNPDGTLDRRHEHWDSAMQDAQAAAASIMGDARPQRTASWFWTDRYGHHVEGVGSMTDLGTSVVRPDAEGRPAVVFRVADDGTLRGAASIDDSMAVRAARRIIDRGIVVDPAQLADPSIPVKKLAR